MSKKFLDFEQPMVELHERIEELKAINTDNSVNIQKEIKQLEKKLTTLGKDIYSNLTPWQIAKIARHQSRPRSLNYITEICPNFIELHGDRHFNDDKSIICGIGSISGINVAIIGQQKGSDTRENLERNFGMQLPEGYRKALRIMKLAEKFGLPLITLIDTNGAYPGVGAEQRNQSEAIGFNLLSMSELKIPIICNIIGEGGSGGALAIAVGDRINMLEYAIYSVITPEGCASILWKDAKKADAAAAILGITSSKIKELNLIDTIVTEPFGGAHNDPQLMIATLKKTILAQLYELKDITTDNLLATRMEKIMSYGQFAQV